MKVPTYSLTLEQSYALAVVIITLSVLRAIVFGG